MAFVPSLTDASCGRLVKGLVGEFDFSFAVDTPNLVTVSTADRANDGDHKEPDPEGSQQ